MTRPGKKTNPQNLNRRTALTTLLAGGGVASCAAVPQLNPFAAKTSTSAGVFASGVASGDPETSRVILWTRLSKDGATPLPGSQLVHWEIAKDEGFADICADGDTRTSPARDGTVKVDAPGLAPGTPYYYRFRYGDTRSPVGRTKTLPAGATTRARFAVVSCSNYPFGYFNVYDHIARHDDLDAVIHLGDYIYEYGGDGYGGETGRQLERNHQPGHEIITLADYRLRHRQYKSDPAAKAMHQAHPLIAIWDDHEIANNSWQGGAQNHSPATEGQWEVRRRAALQAYYEWMPVREPEPGRAQEAFFRSFSYGDLLTIGAIETRLMARTRELQYSEVLAGIKGPEDLAHFRDKVLNHPDRQMLGATQASWLEQTLARSADAGQPWRLLANQIIMGRTISPDLTAHMSEDDIVALEAQWDQARAFIQATSLGLPANFDAWDGYPAARQRFYELAQRANNCEGLIVITGDTHTWWANDLTADNGTHMGVELGVHSVTSPSPYRKEFLGGKGEEYAALTKGKNKDVRYLDGEAHGYIDLTVTRESAEARFIAIDTITQPSYHAFEKAAFTINRKGGRAQFAPDI